MMIWQRWFSRYGHIFYASELIKTPIHSGVPWCLIAETSTCLRVSCHSILYQGCVRKGQVTLGPTNNTLQYHCKHQCQTKMLCSFWVTVIRIFWMQHPILQCWSINENGEIRAWTEVPSGLSDSGCLTQQSCQTMNNGPVDPVRPWIKDQMILSDHR